MTPLERRKRELLAQSEVYRQTLGLEAKRLSDSVNWFPRTVTSLRRFAPLLLFGMPVAGFFFATKKHDHNGQPPPPSKKKRGFLGKALLALEVFNRVRPVVQSFSSHRSNRS